MRNKGEFVRIRLLLGIVTILTGCATTAKVSQVKVSAPEKIETFQLSPLALEVLDETKGEKNQKFVELAEKELSAEAKNSANFKGMLLIKKQIQDFLKNQGLEEIKSIAEKFDPNLHEVVEEIRMEDKEPGIIMEEIQKGYKINGRLLKPAKVKVSK